MAVPAFIRLSDSGVPLDPGLRRVLEQSFSVDLSGVRLHAGPRTAAFLRLHGHLAAAAGHRVFMPAARRGDSERWLGGPPGQPARPHAHAPFGVHNPGTCRVSVSQRQKARSAATTGA